MENARSTQRSALVTGSASGLMRGVCVSLAQRGYAIAANYRAPRTNADDTVRAVRAAGGRIEAFAADVSLPDQAASLVAATQQAFGSIDVLVCGAGPMIVKDVNTTTLDEYRLMVDGNMSSVFYTVKAVLPLMRERHFGRVITFGMTGAEVTMGWRHLAAYAAAKSAVITFTRSLALEEGPNGITCNVVNVGDIRDKNADRSAVLQRRDYRNPLMRPGSWQDVGDAVAYLASDDASFVTGSVLNVNGGWQGFLAEFSRWP
ncbi:MAG: SDR family oxidoreductase [Candidatus Eremiobacteraeota bacterium]|nr:SDR family oxidoreductase [Candidatus Eremiobacteraeota bacterium]